MKNLHLKIFSLAIFFILCIGTACAYQTLAFDFPNGAGNWIVAYHRSLGNETIVQYVPSGQTYQNWDRTLIIHSYKNSTQTSALTLLRTLTAQLENINDYSKYQYERITQTDAIASRCVIGNARMTSQCDIYRAMQSFDGYYTMQYINKDMESFKSNYFNWLEAMKKAKPYQAHFRNDRYLNKDNFEL